jgi:hypothetical protein
MLIDQAIKLRLDVTMPSQRTETPLDVFDPDSGMDERVTLRRKSGQDPDATRNPDPIATERLCRRAANE